MRTSGEAARVAVATGCRRLPGNEPGSLSRRLDVGDDLERYRSSIEEVSVLFKLFDGGGNPVPSGWTVTAAKFEVAWPDDPSVVRSHFGARRKAYNWALDRVKADLDAKKTDPTHASVAWNLAALRRRWNQEKADIAPWWAENSKECYSSGIADLVDALGNWSASRNGGRKGRKVGFPRFSSAHRDPGRVRFTTGTMRIEDDRRTITLPVIGALRSKESTRRVQRFLARGDARILSMTLSERWGRLFVAVNYAVRSPGRRPVARPGVRAGVDLGLRTLASVADTDGNIIEFSNPAPLRATLSERRSTGRQMSRRLPGSRGHRRAKDKLARLDRRVVHLRQDAWHKLSSELTATYAEVVIEDLDIAAMKRSMGRRAFRRSVSDASLGMFAPMLAYKAERSGVNIVKADRWFPSSQVHHGCGCRLHAPGRLAKHLVCERTGELVDRDINAAKNLRDWPETSASPGLVETSAPVDTRAATSGGTDPGSDRGTTHGRRSDRKTYPSGKASRGEARTEPDDRQARNPARGAA